MRPSPDSTVSRRSIMRVRHPARMAVVFSVLGDTEDEAQAALARLFVALDLDVISRPSRIIGRDRWLARATPPDTSQSPAR